MREKPIIKVHWGYNEYGILAEQPSKFQLRLMRIFAGITFETVSVDVTVNYSQISGRWYLKSIFFIDVNKLTRKDKEYIYTTERELMISSLIEDGKAINNDKLLQSGMDFSDQLGPYDEAFWGNYSIILATDDFKSKIK